MFPQKMQNAPERNVKKVLTEEVRDAILIKLSQGEPEEKPAELEVKNIRKKQKRC